MNKETVRETMLSHQQEIINELSEQISTVHTMVDIDEEMTHDPEDYSHQFESNEIEQLIKVQLNKAKSGLQHLESIDFGPKNTVTAGALVKTNKMKFFIGFPTVPFDAGEDHIVGISLGSPIYPMMANKKVGDSFTFSGNEYNIESIY
jgi:hypothetical protein